MHVIADYSQEITELAKTGAGMIQGIRNIVGQELKDYLVIEERPDRRGLRVRYYGLPMLFRIEIRAKTDDGGFVKSVAKLVAYKVSYDTEEAETQLIECTFDRLGNTKMGGRSGVVGGQLVSQFLALVFVEAMKNGSHLWP